MRSVDRLSSISDRAHYLPASMLNDGRVRLRDAGRKVSHFHNNDRLQNLSNDAPMLDRFAKEREVRAAVFQMDRLDTGDFQILRSAFASANKSAPDNLQFHDFPRFVTAPMSQNFCAREKRVVLTIFACKSPVNCTQSSPYGITFRRSASSLRLRVAPRDRGCAAGLARSSRRSFSRAAEALRVPACARPSELLNSQSQVRV